MVFVRSGQDESAPRVELRIVTDHRFQLVNGFAYRDHSGVLHPIPRHDPAEPPAAVPPEKFYTDQNSTDLASIPWFLWSFYSSYGRQSLPALLHDALCAKADQVDLSAPGGRDTAWAMRSEADRLFRESLGDQGVRPFRREVLFAGVTAGRYGTYGTAGRKLLMLAQVLFGLVTSTAVVWALVERLRGLQTPGWAAWALVVACLVVLAGVVLRRGGDWVLPAVAFVVGTPMLIYLLVYSVLVVVLNLPDVRPGKGGLDVVTPFFDLPRRRSSDG